MRAASLASVELLTTPNLYSMVQCLFVTWYLRQLSICQPQKFNLNRIKSLTILRNLFYICTSNSKTFRWVRVNQCICFLPNVFHFLLPPPLPAGSTHWSLAGSGKQKTFSRKCIHWFTRTPFRVRVNQHINLINMPVVF